MKLLLIEDHPAMQATLQRSFERRGMRVAEPISTGDPARGGAGLGLAICNEIVASLGGQIELTNRTQGGRVAGLEAVVRLPLHAHAATP